MSDLGQLLKKARIQKGFTLDQLQDITKIRKRYLEAIEDGNYKVLPGNFYVRAFIKSYSEAVGLEPDEVLRLYRSEVPVVDQEPVVEPKRRRTKPVRNSEKMSRWASVLLLFAFPLLIIGVVYYYIYYTKEPSNTTDNPQSLTENKANENPDHSAIENNNQPEPPIEPDPEPELPEPELSLAKAEGNTDFYSLIHAEQLLVELEVVGDSCWMAVRKDSVKGEFIIQSITLHKGDKKEWIFDGSAYFHFGKANALQVKINGIPINVGDSPNPRMLQIDLQTEITI